MLKTWFTSPIKHGLAIKHHVGDQEPRPKRHAVTVDLALIDPETPKALSANLKNHVPQDTRQGLQDAGLQDAV